MAMFFLNKALQFNHLFAKVVAKESYNMFYLGTMILCLQILTNMCSYNSTELRRIHSYFEISNYKDQIRLSH